MKSKKKQQGFTLMGWMTIVIGIVFVAYLAMKLIPPYVQNYVVKGSIQTAITDLKKESNLTFGQFQQMLEDKFNKHLEINQINSITHKDLQIKQGEQGTIIIDLKYDRTIPLFGNLDALIHFQNKIQVNQK